MLLVVTDQIKYKEFVNFSVHANGGEQTEWFLSLTIWVLCLSLSQCVTVHPGQLSLTICLSEGAMSTSQRECRYACSCSLAIKCVIHVKCMSYLSKNFRGMQFNKSMFTLLHHPMKEGWVTCADIFMVGNERNIYHSPWMTYRPWDIRCQNRHPVQWRPLSVCPTVTPVILHATHHHGKYCKFTL